MTIKEALEFGNHSLDAEVFLCYLLKKDKAWLYSHQDDILTSEQANKYQKLITRRKKGEPIAYITNHKEFFGLNFYVDKNVLIPRPETEILVEEAIKCHSDPAAGGGRIPRDPSTASQDDKYKIIDLGTGSGCIIISIAKSLSGCHSRLDRESIYKIDPRWSLSRMDSRFRGNDMRDKDDTIEYYASDISASALKVARKNAHKHQVKVNFIKSDLFKSIPKSLKFDLIVANLPYLWKDYPLFEPRLALDGGRGGLQVIKRFLIEAKSHLKKDSTIILEIDPRQAEIIKKITKKIYPQKVITLKKDLAGLDRAVILS